MIRFCQMTKHMNAPRCPPLSKVVFKVLLRVLPSGVLPLYAAAPFKKQQTDHETEVCGCVLSGSKYPKTKVQCEQVDARPERLIRLNYM